MVPEEDLASYSGRWAPSTPYIPTMVPNMRAPAMNADDLKAAILELERFHQRFSRFFCRTEG